MTWVNAVWLLSALLAAWLLYRLERKKGNHYTFVDVLLNHRTNRADINSHILLVMTLMAVWVCIDRSNDGKDVDTLVLGVLGIFVTGRVASKGIEMYKDKGRE